MMLINMKCNRYFLHYWKSASGKLMVKVTELHGIGDEVVEADDVNINYPETLVLYIMGSCIGV